MEGAISLVIGGWPTRADEDIEEMQQDDKVSMNKLESR